MIMFCVLSRTKDPAYAKTLGCQVLMAVYKGIAPGERKALPSLDINSRRLADSLLQLAFSLSQKVSGILKFRLDSFLHFPRINGVTGAAIKRLLKKVDYK